MRILRWLLGEKKSAVSDDARGEKPAGIAASPPSPRRHEPVDREADNLRRWRASGQARAWVAAHRGQWNHDDWLTLLEELKRSAFWPLRPDAVGQALEEIKREAFP